MHKINRSIGLSLFIILAVSIGGCATTQEKRKTAQQLYDEGEKALAGRRTLFFFHTTDYERAEGAFEKIRNRYSYTTFAALAELRLADIHFMKEEYAEAATEYRDFIELHPEHEEVPYALKRVGFSYFNQIGSVDREQVSVENARIHFQELIDKFPKSEHAEGIQEKTDYCKNMLAGHEFSVGHFYFKNKKYEAAIGRLKRSLELYPGYGPKENALLYLGKSYIADDDVEKGNKALENLMAAFPDSEQAAEAAGLLN